MLLFDNFRVTRAGEAFKAAQSPVWRELRAMSTAAHCGGMYHSHIADQLAAADYFCM